MIPFLKQVADHYFDSGRLEERCFIFPNRRSMEFFRKYLNESVKDRPLIHPEMITMNDFFAKASGMRVEGRVMLLLRLYDCYRKLNPAAEPLDEFIFWGDVILGDFGDVDKYLANPFHLFRNIAEFRDIQDTYAYLDEDQKAAIRSFIRHFREENGRMRVDLGNDDPNVKERFLKIWNLLLPLYESFTKSLRADGAAYEGMVYRSLAERLGDEAAVDVLSGAFPWCRGFVFVGLNALNECEKKVMGRMRDAGIAEFWWDYAGAMVRDPRNRSSFFMEKNVRDFPPAGGGSAEDLPVPEINVVSVPSAVGQAKQIPYILGRIGGNITDVGRCAIVLPDENLLPALLNSIPDTVGDINVTMGSPMTGSAFYSFMNDVNAMQIHIRRRGGKPLFYHRQVWSIFSSSIFRRAMDADAEAVAARIRQEAKYYIPEEDFRGSALTEAVFKAVVEDPKVASGAQVRGFEDYQCGVISTVAPLLKRDEEMIHELEYMRMYLQCVNRLKTIDLPVLPVTYARLLGQLMSGLSVPYEGEPLKGLQVMGPLETRALDFDNLILLSCNEGVFPKRTVASSFIPPELRKGFGLPTYEYQDSVWAYYFYRMIQRASTVWLLYDSRTEGLRGGEESRYIKQLEYHFGVKVNRLMARGTVQIGTDRDSEEKPADIERILKEERWLSASSLQAYLACPAKFYYHVVRQLKPETEVTENLDSGMLGNVYHGVMQALYLGEEAMEPGFSLERNNVASAVESGRLKPRREITIGYIESWLERKNDIRSKIRALILEQLHSIEVSGRDLVVEDVILKYVIKTLQRDIELMKEKGLDRFGIVGLELKKTWEKNGFRFLGFIDRMDVFGDEVRIVDYKTGKVREEETDINEGNAEAVVEALFGDDNQKRPQIAMQLFLYDMYVKDSSATAGRRVSNAVYSVANLFVSPPKSVPVSARFCSLMEERLDGLLAEMVDVSKPFRRTESIETCKYCDFKTICGR